MLILIFFHFNKIYCIPPTVHECVPLFPPGNLSPVHRPPAVLKDPYTFTGAVNTIRFTAVQNTILLLYGQEIQTPIHPTSTTPLSRQSTPFSRSGICLFRITITYNKTWRFHHKGGLYTRQEYARVIEEGLKTGGLEVSDKVKLLCP